MERVSGYDQALTPYKNWLDEESAQEDDDQEDDLDLGSNIY